MSLTPTAAHPEHLLKLAELGGDNEALNAEIERLGVRAGFIIDAHFWARENLRSQCRDGEHHHEDTMARRKKRKQWQQRGEEVNVALIRDKSDLEVEAHIAEMLAADWSIEAMGGDRIVFRRYREDMCACCERVESKCDCESCELHQYKKNDEVLGLVPKSQAVRLWEEHELLVACLSCAEKHHAHLTKEIERVRAGKPLA